MDLDSDLLNTRPRCKDINGLWVFIKGTVMTFVGGDIDH
jgi:hypothetical protein